MENPKIFFLFSIFFVLILGAFAGAHSLFLFDIKLDFDKELKLNVISAAKKFANTTKEPINFDLDKGIIIAHFEPDERNYVEVYPPKYEIFGMHNENLKHNAGEIKFTKENGYEIAKKEFDKLPEKIKSELEYTSEVGEFEGVYFYKWLRKVNGVLVAGEDFMADVDAVNGNVVAWRLAVFDYPKESIDTVPAISKNVARKIAELTFNEPSAKGFEPYLIINSNQLIWVNKLQGQLYPIFAGVDAKDGDIDFTGTLPGFVPDDYKTENEKVAETDLIKNIYAAK